MEPGSSGCCQVIGQDAQAVPPEHEEEPCYCADDQALEQVVKRIVVSLTGDIQHLPGYNPE